jgi:predicted nuclease of restriction endonuclease-like RecB superfamily
VAFRLQDLCKTTRRQTGDGLPRLFPRLLGDDRFAPRLDIAIRCFETNLGRQRAELDTEALLTLFGDPRLARGLLRCFTRTYRYCARLLADVLGAEQAAALAARGLATPRDLRALVYARANQAGGFVAPEKRGDFLGNLVADLTPAELEGILWLDAADQAVLVRNGPLPSAADIRACYNLQVLETLLCAAPESRFAVHGDRARVEAVAARHAVQAAVNGAGVTLHGCPDAFGSWMRHGARVARTALMLLAEGTLGPGTATVQLGDQQYEVRLDATLLQKALPPRCWSAPESTWGAGEAVVRAIQELRRRGRLAGWRLRWWPEPLIAEQGLLWPELALRHGATSVGLLPLTTEQVQADVVLLGRLAERFACIILTPQEVTCDLPAGLTVIPYDDQRLAALLAGCLERNIAADLEAAPPECLMSLIESARAAGSLAESDLAWRLNCDEEGVGIRLAPATDTVSDVVYIDGFGLCTATLLELARTLIAEEATRNAGRLELARLGRRLRELVGRNEGLHALIAYLSGDLQPVG